jgi:UDP-N-acetyl-2-amino-2-deoxyglucuronate dehydrogenase
MLKFAVVGCGRIGKRHAELLSSGEVPGAELVAVCDVIPERVEAFSQTYHCRGFNSLSEMFHCTKPDVVVVCTPSGDHARTAIKAAQLGSHIVVEKPMALTLDDADKMIFACAEAKVKLFVVKQNRFNLPILKVREIIENGSLGKLTLGTVRVRWCRTDEYYKQDAWRGTWQNDGGVLANQASHHIDALEWMLGDVDSVYAISKTALASIEVEDTALALLKFTSGALGVIEATTAARPRDIEGSLSILGENGTIEVAGTALNKIRTWEFADERLNLENDLGMFSENPPDVYGFGHRRYLEHVVDCVNNDTQQLVDGFEGRKSLALINAIYESIETGREVSLRFIPRESRLGLSNDS